VIVAFGDHDHQVSVGLIQGARVSGSRNQVGIDTHAAHNDQPVSDTWDSAVVGQVVERQGRRDRLETGSTY
jgi:hypothetical protein